MRFAAAKIGTFRYAEHSEFESTCGVGLRARIWGDFVPRILGSEPRPMDFMARVRGGLCSGMVDPSDSRRFRHAHTPREHSKLGLGAACNPHDWHGVGLDMVGFPLLFSRHATRDAIERWRPKARDLHVYRYVVVCRGFDRGISVASVAVLAHVLVFCSSARRRGIGGRLARIGGTGFDYRRCDLDHGRGAEGVLGMAACGESGHAERGIVGLSSHGFGVCFQATILGAGHGSAAVCPPADPMGGCVGCGSHRSDGSLPVVFGPCTFPCLVRVSWRCCFFVGVELAMVDASGKTLDQAGTGGVRCAFGGAAGHSVFSQSVTSEASRAYVPT